MAWWNREELAEAGLSLEEIDAVIFGSPRRRTRRVLDPDDDRIKTELQAWIPKEQPLSAAVFVGASRRGR